MITNDGRLGGNDIGRAGDGVYGDDHQVSLNLTKVSEPALAHYGPA